MRTLGLLGRPKSWKPRPQYIAIIRKGWHGQRDAPANGCGARNGQEAQKSHQNQVLLFSLCRQRGLHGHKIFGIFRFRVKKVNFGSKSFRPAVAGQASAMARTPSGCEIDANPDHRVRIRKAPRFCPPQNSLGMHVAPGKIAIYCTFCPSDPRETAKEAPNSSAALWQSARLGMGRNTAAAKPVWRPRPVQPHTVAHSKRYSGVPPSTGACLGLVWGGLLLRRLQPLYRCPSRPRKRCLLLWVPDRLASLAHAGVCMRARGRAAVTCHGPCCWAEISERKDCVPVLPMIPAPPPPPTTTVRMLVCSAIRPSHPQLRMAGLHRKVWLLQHSSPHKPCPHCWQLQCRWAHIANTRCHLSVGAPHGPAMASACMTRSLMAAATVGTSPICGPCSRSGHD